ncbi:hypothetical protein KC363_g4419 [Hortaea werneckii]|uniref:Uncharacterized protein n=1 Tax=Hortaea werneckii TaxID=91943 RepID=A0A3M7FXZ2_HORWE|nr:hypothetical protein KC325_g6921 [Hortaea werneckii]KAI6989079.1 hypothetical protein KC359_g7392 [Hortaea werneckii]KAI7142774.1 hypothetical protein KC344_g6876 [Hortaea werneckii]KAI7170165.1 hypothetical protein KC360_g6997 [Hortaea werneckii]KAI7190452.1 hypothetical protein KC363_g4419 [Hortaea werneckii]
MASESSTSANTRVGRICRVTRSHNYQVPDAHRSQAFPAAQLYVRKDELGEITDRARTQPASYVRLHDRPGKPIIFILNDDIEISTATWDQDWEFGYISSTINQERSEKTPICAQYLPEEKRTVFHFPKRIALTSHEDLNDIKIFSKNYRDDSGIKKRMKLHWSGPKSSLKAGDELYVSWELMDKYIEHPAPAFPMGRIGRWSNWHEIGRLGLKVTFKRSGSTQWYAMYAQCSSWGKSPMVEGVPGATKSYAYWTAMLAYLQNTRWGQKASWVPFFGVPNMVEVQVHRFHKRVLCRPVQPSGPLPNITYQPDAAKQLLINVKARDSNGVVVSGETLQNVDGPFGQYDVSWVSGRNKVSYLKRTRCDRCWFGHRSDQVAMTDNMSNKYEHCAPVKDNLGRDTNQCVPCFLRGLPCSWTRADWLGGPDWAGDNRGNKTGNLRDARTFSGPLWNQFYESVYGKLTPQVALEPIEVPDPGYVEFLAREGGTGEDESDAEVD